MTPFRPNVRRQLTPLALALLAACHHEAGGTELPESPEAVEPEAVEVTTRAVTAEPVGEVVSVTGHLRAVRDADLGADVVGRITEVLVDEGDTVSEGQVMVRINAAHARANTAQAEASASGVLATIAQLEQDLARLEPLVAEGVVAGAEADRLRTQLDAARANHRAAEAAIRATRSTLPSFEIRAPFAGVVETMDAEVGEIAVAGGPALVRVIDLSTVEAELDVRETALPLVESSPTVQALVRAYGETIGGRVVRIGSSFHPETHAAPVVVEFDNADGRLRAGMFVEVSLRPTEDRRAIVLESALVRGAADARYTYVVRDGVVEKRDLLVTPMADGRYEVTAGLSVGDAVVLSSSRSVSAGQPVQLAALTATPAAEARQ